MTHLGTHRLTNKGATAHDANRPGAVNCRRPEGGPAIQQSVISLMDILPSLLELAGVPQPACLDGESFVDLVGSDHYQVDRTAFIEYTRYEVGHDAFGGLLPMRVLIHDGWKLVLNVPPARKATSYIIIPKTLMN